MSIIYNQKIEKSFLFIYGFRIFSSIDSSYYRNKKLNTKISRTRIHARSNPTEAERILHTCKKYFIHLEETALNEILI
jgi:hypothetical protein